MVFKPSQFVQMSQSLPAKIGFWLSLPLSAMQGLRLKRTALRMPEAAGDRNGHVGNGETLRLLALGDSIIVGVGLEKIAHALPVQFATALAEKRGCRVEWQLDGRNGANICHLRNTISRLDTEQPVDVILISIGVNDVTGLINQRRWQAQLQALVDDLSKKWPDARVIFAGLPPMGKFPLPPQPLRFTLGFRAATLDHIAAELLETKANILHVPTSIDPEHQQFCDDGFHPSRESCEFWAFELAQRIEADNLSSHD